MKRRHRHQPHHESPHEARLREVVDELIPDTERRPVYLQFARELDLSLRRPPPALVIPREPGDSRNLSANRNLSDPSTPVGVTGPATTRNRYFPDFSTRTKRVVARWLRRGLSGRTLWRIGEALIGRLFPAGR